MATVAIPTTEEALSYAIGSIRRADVARGRKALTWVLQRDPENVAAWLWLANCSEDPRQRAVCLRKVTELDPLAG